MTGGVSHPGMNALLSSRALKPLTSALPLHALPTLRPSTERVCREPPSGIRAPVAGAARSGSGSPGWRTRRCWCVWEGGPKRQKFRATWGSNGMAVLDQSSIDLQLADAIYTFSEG